MGFFVNKWTVGTLGAVTGLVILASCDEQPVTPESGKVIDVGHDDQNQVQFKIVEHVDPEDPNAPPTLHAYAVVPPEHTGGPQRWFRAQFQAAKGSTVSGDPLTVDSIPDGGAATVFVVYDDRTGDDTKCYVYGDPVTVKDPPRYHTREQGYSVTPGKGRLPKRITDNRCDPPPGEGPTWATTEAVGMGEVDGAGVKPIAFVRTPDDAQRLHDAEKQLRHLADTERSYKTGDPATRADAVSAALSEADPKALRHLLVEAHKRGGNYGDLIEELAADAQRLVLRLPVPTDEVGNHKLDLFSALAGDQPSTMIEKMSRREVPVLEQALREHNDARRPSAPAPERRVTPALPARQPAHLMSRRRTAPDGIQRSFGS